MTITYSSVSESHSVELYNCMKKLDTETNYMLYSEQERHFKLSEMTSMIEKVNRSGLLLAAIKENKIVGYVSLEVSELSKIKHIRYIVLGVLKEYSNNGIGTRLMKEIIDYSLESGLHKLELTVVKENKWAVQLYEKMGFFIEGTKKDSLYMKDKYFDEYYMGKIL